VAAFIGEGGREGGKDEGEVQATALLSPPRIVANTGSTALKCRRRRRHSPGQTFSFHSTRLQPERA